MKRTDFVSNKFVKKPYVPVFKIGAMVRLGETLTDFGKDGKIVGNGGVGSDSKFWVIEWEKLEYSSIVNEKDLILLEQ